MPAGPSNDTYVLYAGDYIQFEGLNTYGQNYITNNGCDGTLKPVVYSSDYGANRNRFTSFYAPIYDFNGFMQLPARKTVSDC